MKKLTKLSCFTVFLVGFAFSTTAQINTGAGGATAVVANAPTTNTNVGIGTNVPKSKLDVKGALTVGATYGGVSAAPTSGAIIEGNVGIGITVPKSKLDVKGGVAIGTTYAGVTASPANGAIIEGNVGIGVTSPIEKLEVNGALVANKGVFTVNQPDGGTFPSYEEEFKLKGTINAGRLVASNTYRRQLTFVEYSSTAWVKPTIYFSIEDRNDNNRLMFNCELAGSTTLALRDKSQSEYFTSGEDGNGNAFLQMAKPNTKVVIGGYSNDPVAANHKFYVKNGSAKIDGNILTDSNIGIGTVNFIDGTDTYRLSVKGKVRAEEVKVYNTWADYVFSNNYKLPTLKDVEKFITTNGHLQNVPSAKEISEKGLALGEMAKIQQEKIEELTLYIIQMNKEIELLKAKIKN